MNATTTQQGILPLYWAVLPPPDAKTVLKVDLDVDSNNDGVIDSDDNGEELYESYPPGVIVCKDRLGDGTNLDHLVEMRLTLLPATLTNGTVKLTAVGGGGTVKVWTNVAKSLEVALPATYDLAVSKVPSSLWIDGVSTGQVFLDLTYQSPDGGFACTDRVAVYVTKTVSYSPAGTNVYGWNPCSWLYNGARDTRAAEMLLGNVSSQGWDTVHCCWDFGDGDDWVNNCTLANFKAMAHAGFVEILTHGDPDGICAAYFVTKSAASNWIAGESNMFVYLSTVITNPAMYYVWVAKQWFQDNWRTNLDARNAMTVFDTCESATGTNRVIDCAGGRSRFGYDGTVYVATNNYQMLFGRMNGSLVGAEKRCAGEAYDGGTGYDFGLKLAGSDWTTLCPAPVAVFPATIAKRKGWGCVLFDTYMDGTIAATSAVTRLVGTIAVTNFHWIDNGSGKYGVGFEFDNRPGSGVIMRAQPDKCKNSAVDGNGRQLDGDRVRPNGDELDWCF